MLRALSCYIIPGLFLLPNLLSAQGDTASIQGQPPWPSVFPIPGIEIPASDGENIITHSAFTLRYSIRHRQAEWVAYTLTAQELVKVTDRSDRFKQDPGVNEGTATDADYYKSGYDRGHLAPAADMCWSVQSMEESFYYSNISPQIPSFNRGIWRKAEEQVRSWAMTYDTVCVITGPVLSGSLHSIGRNKVSVPGHFYKVVLARIPSHGYQALAFIMPNQASKASVTNYVFSVDSAEALTGINFLQALPDSLESRIERTVCDDCWNWRLLKFEHHSADSKPEKAERCTGITQAGVRCRRMTYNRNRRCYQH